MVANNGYWWLRLAGGYDDDDVGSNENCRSLSPPTNNSVSGGGDAEVEKSDDVNGDNVEHRQNDPYQEVPYNRCDKSLVIDMTIARPNMFPYGSSLGGSRRGGSESRRGRRQQNVTLEYSFASNIVQSFSDFGIG